jgi:hypothetical protein
MSSFAKKVHKTSKLSTNKILKSLMNQSISRNNNRMVMKKIKKICFNSSSKPTPQSLKKTRSLANSKPETRILSKRLIRWQLTFHQSEQRPKKCWSRKILRLKG